MKASYLIPLVLGFSSFYRPIREISHLPRNKPEKDTCSIIKQQFTIASKRSIISGVILDCETQKPLKLGVLNIDGNISYTDSLGRFHQAIKPGKCVVRVGWPSYKFETIKTKLRLRDSLYIVFYLSYDQQPLEESQDRSIRKNSSEYR